MSHEKLVAVSLVALTVILALAACGGGQAKIEPPTIYYGEDVCDHCNMIINDERFAAATIVEVEPGRTDSRIFDDIGGMFLYHDEHPDLRVLARYVHDYETKEWINAEEAYFVHSSEVHSPMNHGVIACKTPDEADRLAEEFNGEVVDYDGLVALADAGTFAGPRMKMDMEDTGENQ
ncbi:MAG: hypothetical protein MAG451_00864 [Anaerolineales bacterium]|nr:hypothetical protein [Anaerolineales bacterium]